MGTIICFDTVAITETEYDFLYKNVSLERQANADRYRFFSDKIKCVVAGAILRYILTLEFCEKYIPNQTNSENQKCFFDMFSFEKNRYGKPYIKEIKNFHFNVSHSGKWVAVAYSKKNIGIDIEKIDRNRNYVNAKSIAERYFCKEECDYIFEDEVLFQNRFIQIWTAKESYLKYKGVGISKIKNSENTLDLIKKGLYSTVFDNEYYLSCYSEDKENDIKTISYDTLKESLDK